MLWYPRIYRFCARLFIALAAVAWVQTATASTTMTYGGTGTAYYFDSDYVPPGLPEFIPINFFATLTFGAGANPLSGFFSATRIDTGSILTSSTLYDDVGRSRFGINGLDFSFEAPFRAPGYAGYGNITSINGSAVPEPSTWAMMLVGFGALGFGLRRSRRKSFTSLIATV